MNHSLLRRYQPKALVKPLLSAVFSLLLLFFFTLLLTRSDILQNAAKEALLFSVESLIPSLFPFAVLSRFLLLSELLPKGGRIGETLASLFALPKEALGALLAGLFCGFPMGAFAAASLLEGKKLSEENACRLAAFANNPSVAFSLVTVSTLFNDPLCGKLIFISETAAALAVGLIWGLTVKRKSQDATTPPLCREKPALLPLAADCVVKGGLAMLNVTAFVVFFSVMGEALALVPVLSSASPVLRLFLEATSGARLAASWLTRLGKPLSLSLAAFSLGFSGISVLMQSEALFLGKIPIRRLLLARLAVATLAALFTLALSFGFSL